MGLLRAFVPICATDLFGCFQYQARLHFLPSRAFLEGEFRASVRGDVRNFRGRVSPRVRRLVVCCFRVVHVDGEGTRLLSGLANVCLVFRRGDHGADFHVSICRHPVCEDDSSVLEWWEYVRIGYTRAQRVPCCFKGRARDGCGLWVNLWEPRFLCGDLVLRFLQLGCPRALEGDVFFRQAELRRATVSSRQFIKRDCRACCVVTSFGRSFRTLRHGVKDARVCSPRVFLFRVLALFGLREGRPAPTNAGWVF